MGLIKISAGSSELDRIMQLPVALFPDNVVLHLESASIFQTHLLHAYLLCKDGKDIGSIALYNNPGHFYNGKRALAVGYFHCIDDQGAADSLIRAVKLDAKELGIPYLIGPLNGSTWETYRFRTSDQPGPFFMEPASPAYYNHLFEQAGFVAIQSYSSFLEKPIREIRPQVIRRENELKNAGIRFRNIDPENYERDLRRIHELSHVSFADNFLFTSHSFEDYIRKYSLLDGIARPELTFLAEDGDRLAGFVFMIDDILCTTEKRIVFKTYAVLPDTRYAGLGAVLSERLLDNLRLGGYQSAIRALVAEGSVSHSISKRDTSVFMSYKLYVLHVD